MTIFFYLFEIWSPICMIKTIFDPVFFQSVSPSFHLLVRKIWGQILQVNYMYLLPNTRYLHDNRKTSFLKIKQKSSFFVFFLHLFLLCRSGVTLYTRHPPSRKKNAMQREIIYAFKVTWLLKNVFTELRKKLFVVR